MMSKIHYFQRYSSNENTVTNNTLLLFARIYDYSPSAASTVLTDLIGESVEIGIEIQQQKQEVKSVRNGSKIKAVPDGTIIQRSFKILIEAKVDAEVDPNQLINHAATFTNESQKVLLLLTKQHITASQFDALETQIREVSRDIIFKNITYEQVCDSIKGKFKEHEESMSVLVNDYIEYCNDANLFDQSKVLMRIVPCGQSININKKYGIYFHPSDRGYTNHAFVGIYADKKVQSVWKIDSVFDVELKNDGTLCKECVQGKNTDEFDLRLRSIIKDAKAECGYEVANGHRFFCGSPFETNFEKVSSGGIYGARFINLRETIGEFTDLSEVAAELRQKVWK